MISAQMLNVQCGSGFQVMRYPAGGTPASQARRLVVQVSMTCRDLGVP
jgi:hypothetical protein